MFLFAALRIQLAAHKKITLNAFINEISRYSSAQQTTISLLRIHNFNVKSEVFTAVTMKNVFWDIKTQFLPHRKHNVSATETSRLILFKI
jgi:predicted DNA-binding ribbon-helix-helix protein